jgi:hypothetical protein
LKPGCQLSEASTICKEQHKVCLTKQPAIRGGKMLVFLYRVKKLQHSNLDLLGVVFCSHSPSLYFSHLSSQRHVIHLFFQVFNPNYYWKPGCFRVANSVMTFINQVPSLMELTSSRFLHCQITMKDICSMIHTVMYDEKNI